MSFVRLRRMTQIHHRAFSTHKRHKRPHERARYDRFFAFNETVHCLSRQTSAHQCGNFRHLQMRFHTRHWSQFEHELLLRSAFRTFTRILIRKCHTFAFPHRSIARTKESNACVHGLAQCSVACWFCVWVCATADAFLLVPAIRLSYRTMQKAQFAQNTHIARVGGKGLSVRIQNAEMTSHLALRT